MKPTWIVALILACSGCTYSFEPFKNKPPVDSEKTEQLIQAVNALNQFAVKMQKEFQALKKEMEPVLRKAQVVPAPKKDEKY